MYAYLSFTLSTDLASFLNAFKDSSKGHFEKEYVIEIILNVGTLVQVVKWVIRVFE